MPNNEPQYIEKMFCFKIKLNFSFVWCRTSIQPRMIHNDFWIILWFEDLISVSNSRSSKIKTTKRLLIDKGFIFIKCDCHIAHSLILYQLAKRGEKFVSTFEFYHQKLGI